VTALGRIINRNYEKWDLSSDQEFFIEYRDLKFTSAEFKKFAVGNTCQFMLFANPTNTRFICKALTKEHIEQVFSIFEASLARSLLPEEPVVKLPETRIFIGPWSK
jgi:hypothetical protein